MKANNSEFRVSKLKRSDLLFAEGDPCHGAWILTRGKVAIRVKAGARFLTIEHAGPGAVLGLAEAVGGGRFRTAAVAVTKIEVKFVPRNDVLQIIQDDPVTGLELIQMLSRDVATLYSALQRHSVGRAVN